MPFTSHRSFIGGLHGGIGAIRTKISAYPLTVSVGSHDSSIQQNSRLQGSLSEGCHMSMNLTSVQFIFFTAICGRDIGIRIPNCPLVSTFPVVVGWQARMAGSPTSVQSFLDSRHVNPSYSRYS